MIRIIIAVLGVVATIAIAPILLIGKTLVLIGDTVCYFVCMGMARLFTAMKWSGTALSWLRIYRKG